MYDIKWFEDNFVAVPSGVFCNCSACCFRNLSKEMFCDKLQCRDENSGVCVFWNTKVQGRGGEFLMGIPPKEATEWFDKTSFDCAQKITRDIINKALQNHKQNVK